MTGLPIKELLQRMGKVEGNEKEREPAQYIQHQQSAEPAPPLAVGIAHPVSHEANVNNAGDQHDENRDGRAKRHIMPVAIGAHFWGNQETAKRYQQISNQYAGPRCGEHHQPTHWRAAFSTILSE